jgi:hypothetical protein
VAARGPGDFKGKQGMAKGYTTASLKGGHIQHTGCRSRRGEPNPGLGCRHAGQVALLQTLTAVLSKSVAADKGGKR